MKNSTNKNLNEVRCQFIIPFKGETLKIVDIDEKINNITNTKNVFSIGEDRMSNCTITNSSNLIFLSGGLAPNLSTFWNKVKFCWFILRKY